MVYRGEGKSGEFKMMITKDIKGESYQKLIRYALDTSDAVMVVIDNDPPKLTTVEESEKRWKKHLPHIPISHIAWENWAKAEEQSKQDQIIYQEQYPSFVQSLSPYLIKTRHDLQWPSTQIFFCNCTYTISVYRICEELYPLLLKPGSYFSWRYPRYPEDLSFFKDNRCWLYASSHEGYVEFLPRSQGEYDFVSSLGIPLDEPYEPVDESVFYREEYSL